LPPQYKSLAWLWTLRAAIAVTSLCYDLRFSANQKRFTASIENNK
jgi:hypothetical protein